MKTARFLKINKKMLVHKRLFYGSVFCHFINGDNPVLPVDRLLIFS